VLKLWDGSRKRDELYLVTRTCIKPTNKLVNSHLEALAVLRQATGDLGLTWLTTTQTRGSHHLPPYNILCVTPWHLHLFSRDSQGGVLKLSWFELPRLWEFITLYSDLQLRWGLKQTCSSPQGLSNDVLHFTCTHQGQVDSWILVVKSQFVNLTPNPSFDHNFCCKCSNDSYKAIFDIYTSRPFQRYE
jgi:hypothetical protein